MRTYTILNIIEDDPESLIRLLREVYSRGINDGVIATTGNEFDTDAVFHDWDAAEVLLDKEVGSIEDFVDLIFEIC